MCLLLVPGSESTPPSPASTPASKVSSAAKVPGLCQSVEWAVVGCVHLVPYLANREAVASLWVDGLGKVWWGWGGRWVL